MALKKGIWDPKTGVTNIQGTNLRKVSGLMEKKMETTIGLGFRAYYHYLEFGGWPF